MSASEAALEDAIAGTTAAMIEAAGGGEPVTGARLIAAEHRRHRMVEGYTLEHDIGHGFHTLLRAGGAYLWGDRNGWPRGWEWKPKNPLRDLIRAGALFESAREVCEAIGERTSAVERCAGERDNAARLIDELLDEARNVLGIAATS